MFLNSRLQQFLLEQVSFKYSSPKWSAYTSKTSSHNLQALWFWAPSDTWYKHNQPFSSSHSSTYPFSTQESVQAGGAVDPGKPEDWMNSQVPPGHAKAYSGPNKFISGARIGRKVHICKTFLWLHPSCPPQKGGWIHIIYDTEKILYFRTWSMIHIIYDTEKILYFRTWSRHMKSIGTDPKLFPLFSGRKISVRSQGDIYSFSKQARISFFWVCTLNAGNLGP